MQAVQGGLLGGQKSSPVRHKYMLSPADFSSPLINEDLPGQATACIYFSITGLAVLGGQYHSLSGTEFSASKRVTCLLPATQAESHAGSKVYI